LKFRGSPLAPLFANIGIASEDEFQEYRDVIDSIKRVIATF